MRAMNPPCMGEYGTSQEGLDWTRQGPVPRSQGKIFVADRCSSPVDMTESELSSSSPA